MNCKKFKNNWSTPDATIGKINELEKDMVRMEDEIKNIADVIYPIGSIYMSMNDINPNLLFGGTWTQINDNRFLLCSSSSKQTGGSTTIETENMPSHTHTFEGDAITGGIEYLVRYDAPDTGAFSKSGCFSNTTQSGSRTWTGSGSNGAKIGVQFNATPTGAISSTGGGQAYWQPYMTVFCWYRVK